MSALPRLPMLAISLLQGLMLFGLYRAEDSNSWPSASPLWSFPLWTIAVAVPLLLLLTITRENLQRAAKEIGIFSAVLALLAVYIGYQAEPFGEFQIHSMVFTYIAATLLACFKALMYLQQRANVTALTYPVLFTNSWRNFLVAALASMFVLAFFLILTLWGQLFKVINIDFFWTLFREDWFLFPVLSIAFGTGVLIFRNLTRVIDSITRLLHWLFMLLLPMIVAIAIIFVAALPIVGLDVLWSTGRGTALLLWLLAITLFFSNAVYQDGRETNPYPLIVHRMIYAGLCVLPIVSALSLYGLTLRLQQYGWTVERCWAFVVWLVLSLFAVGYVVGIVRRRDNWTEGLAKVNTAMGLVVLVLMLLINSPVFDFRKISLASQLERIDSGEIALKEFDFWYTSRHLARPGYLALEELKAGIGDADPELLAMVESPMRIGAAVGTPGPGKFWERMTYRPEAFEVPAELATYINRNAPQQFQDSPVMVRIDLDEDGQLEYLVLSTYSYGGFVGRYYFRHEGGWRSGYLQARSGANSGDLAERIEKGEIRLVEPRFKDIDIDGLILAPMQ